MLAAAADPCGPWLAEGLARRGLSDVRLVSIEALVYSRSLTHRVSPKGEASTQIALGDAVVGPELRSTVNRVQSLPLRHLEAMAAADRDYASGEIYALFTSILHSLPGKVVNRGGPRGLSGPHFSDGEWAMLAARAGLPVQHLRWSSNPDIPITDRRAADATLFVIGRAVVGGTHAERDEVPSHVAEGCRRLAELSGVELLAVDFVRSSQRWLFTGACCTPDVRPGGPALLDSLADLLR